MNEIELSKEEFYAKMQEGEAEIQQYEAMVKKLKEENESLKTAKENYYKYWQDAESDLSRIKCQIGAVAILAGNIK